MAESAEKQRHKLLLAWVLVLLESQLLLGVTGQSFQYSRGWTNGKRSEGLDLPAHLLDQTEEPEHSLGDSHPHLTRHCAALYLKPCFAAITKVGERMRGLEDALLRVASTAAETGALTQQKNTRGSSKSFIADYFADQ